MQTLKLQNPKQKNSLSIKPGEREGLHKPSAMKYEERAINPSVGKDNKHNFGDVNLFAGTPSIQAKLSVNTPGDVHEQQADAMAEKVMRMPVAVPQQTKITPVNIIQQKCATCGMEEEKEMSGEEMTEKDTATVQRQLIQRKCADCEKKEEEEKKLQRKETNNAGPAVSPAVNQTLKSSGMPLDAGTRSYMEPRFGFNFSNVQVHNDSLAHQSAKDINALAYTHQNKIVFGAGQYQPGTEEGKKLLAHELTHVVQQRDGNSIQRMASVPTLRNTETLPANSSAAYIVEDGAEMAEGQMQKTTFLQALNEAICITVNEGLRGTKYSSDNCPYIRLAFARQYSSTPLQLQELIERYAPATRLAGNARGLIGLIQSRVMEAVIQWKATGEIPDYDASLLTGSPQPANGGGATGSSAAAPNVQPKTKEGGSFTNQSPANVMHSLGKGNPLDSTTRSRMESAFETDFSNVEIHTNSNAAGIASKMNARAFAVGNHIAFDTGQFNPGTLIGDALMAHELAHTIQQSESLTKNTQLKSDTTTNLLEEDADNTAITVVTKMLGLNTEKIPKSAKSSLKTGLKLQRCTATDCPGGYSWGIVNRTCAAAVGDCVWACVPFSTSGPSISDPYAPRPSMPSRKHTVGVCTGGLPTVYISCLPLKDGDGNIVGRDTQMGVEPDQDYTGALQGAGEMAGGRGGKVNPHEDYGPNAKPRIEDPINKGKIKEKETPGNPIDPVNPTPVKPAPVEPAKPVPAEPVKPAPVKPVTPTPVEPAKPTLPKPVTPAPVEPAKPNSPKPVTPAPVEPAKPVPTEQVKPTPAEPVKPTPAEPVKPATELPAKPVPEDTVKPIPATPVAPTPAQPGPLAAGEELTIPYKKGNTRATVVEVNDDFVVVSYKSRSKKSSGDVKESISKSKYEELLKSGKIIRWTQERTRLMNKRPDYAPGLVEKVWEKAVKDSPDGIVRDPNTKEVLNWDKTKTRNGQWDMGHKKGAKYSDLVDSLVDGQITYEEFLKEYNDSMNYQPESKSANSSHEFE